MSELKDRINGDLKTAMLARDAFTTETLRGLKGAILNSEISSGKREEGLSDSEIEQLLTKEAKKREEAAALYEQGGNHDSADKERREKQIIEQYLPEAMSDDELRDLVEATVADMPDAQMGQIIGAVKGKAGNSADGSRIAAVVKEAMSS